MITKALVVSPADNEGYKWNVNIPILNGIPNNQQEAEEFQKVLNIKIKNNENLNKENQKPYASLVEIARKEWGTAKVLNYNTNDNSEKALYKSTIENEFLMEATVCGIPGMQNLIVPGDIVYVGFENNDMGAPIILGHLLCKNLEKSRNDYPNQIFNSINIKKSANLPLDTTLNLKDASTGELIELKMSDLANLWKFYQIFKNNLDDNQ